MPEISIIVPVYNAEKYLNRCVDSIIGQSFSDFELILIDDGSSDSSPEMCDKYAENDSRIKVIHQKNSGVSTARNNGIAKASGKYIMFVDSDDYLYLSALESMLKGFSGGAQMVVSSVRMITKDEEFDYCMPSAIYTPQKLMEDYCLGKFPQICVCVPWCKLYIREIICKHNVRFNTDMSLGEDTCFNMGYLSHVSKIASLSDVCYFYMRDNEQSLFSKFRHNCYADTLKTHETVKRTAKINGCSDDAIENIIRQYVSGTIGNLIKSVVTADRSTSLSYMKKLTEDKLLSENLDMLKKGSRHYMVAKAVQKKMYGLIYAMLYLRYRVIKRK